MSLRIRVPIFVVLSLIINSPSYLISRDVIKVGLLQMNTTDGLQYQNLYTSSNNDIGKSTLGKLLLFILTVFRTFFLLMVLFVINVIIGFKFKEHIKKKSTMTFRNKTESNKSY